LPHQFQSLPSSALSIVLVETLCSFTFSTLGLLGVVGVFAILGCSHISIGRRIRVKRTPSPGFTFWAYLTSTLCFLWHYLHFLRLPIPFVPFAGGRLILLPYVPFPFGIILFVSFVVKIKQDFYFLCKSFKVVVHSG